MEGTPQERACHVADELGLLREGNYGESYFSTCYCSVFAMAFEAKP